MAFQPNINTKEKVDQLKGSFKGIIINNKDPMQLRRVQVKVEGILESQDMESLVWASPASGQGSGRRADTGSFNVPDINSAVTITFPNGDIYTPQYSDYTDDTADGQINNLFSEDYPNTKGNIEPDGSWERENEKQGYKEYFHRSGFYHKVDNEGSVVVNIPKNLTIKIGGQVCIQVEDLISIFGKNNLGITIEKEIGIQSKSKFGINVDGDKEEISIQSKHIHLNDKIVYETAKSAKEVLDEAEKALGERMKEVGETRELLAKKGEASKKAIDDYGNAMQGNKKQ